MANPVGSANAVPILDARRLVHFTLTEQHELDELVRSVQPARRSHNPPRLDLFAFKVGPNVSADWLRVPRAAQHCVTLSRTYCYAEGNIAGVRGRARPIPGGPQGANLIPAGYLSEWRMPEEAGSSLNLVLSPSALVSVATETLETDPARGSLHPLLFFEDRYLVQMGAIAEKLTHSSAVGDRLYLESLAHTTAMHLLEHYVDFPARARPVRGRLPLSVLRQIADYVEEQPDSELTLAKLASLARLSPYHFARLFKDTTGQTMHAYVRERRLLRACYLLLATRLPISYIAMETGFADESHFVRSFKAQFGVTPGVVRRSALQ